MVNLAAPTSSAGFTATGASPITGPSLSSAGDAFRAVTTNRAYTDLSALQDIRALGKDDQDAALKAVAKQFESMFIGMMLSSMRQASEVMSKDSLFNSPEQKFFQSMFDDQMSLSMTQGAGTGLADVIYRQMLQEYKPSPQPELSEKRPLAALPERSALLIQALQKTSTPEPDKAPATVMNSQQAINQTAVMASSAEQNNPISSNPANHQSAEKGQWFASAQQFIAAIYPAAKQAAQQLGVDIKGLLSQAALETGWGKHVIQQGDRSSFNLFGIKADSRWQGDSMAVMTHEFYDGQRINKKDRFRAYHSLEQGMQDYCRFLSESERYQSVLAQRPSADQYGYLLQQAGYATDPQYGEKIARIAQGDLLNQALETIETTQDESPQQRPSQHQPIQIKDSESLTRPAAYQSMTTGDQHG